MSGHFRENPKRAIHVLGVISPDLLAKLTPEITKLRDSDEAITVYIDSPGGNTNILNAIESLLRAPNQSGKRSLVTTIVTNQAASAAADLLISGDYAVAFPDAIIHCHGNRTAASDVTLEDAYEMAGTLQTANEQFAIRLARRIVSRLLFILTVHRHEIDTDPRGVDLTSPADVLCEILNRQLVNWSQHYALRWVQEAKELHSQTIELINVVAGVGEAEAAAHPDRAMQEVLILKKLLDYEITTNGASGWSLNEIGWRALRKHFMQIVDFIDGEHVKHHNELFDRHNAFFLTQSELAEYKALNEGDAETAQRWLKEKAWGRMTNFWYFVICLSRRLQTGENRMRTSAAYWLGLVDEVMGLNLISMRQVVEESSKAAAEPELSPGF